MKPGEFKFAKNERPILKIIEDIKNATNKIEDPCLASLELLAPSDLKIWASAYATNIKKYIEFCEPLLDKIIKTPFRREYD